MIKSKRQLAVAFVASIIILVLGVSFLYCGYTDKPAEGVLVGPFLALFGLFAATALGVELIPYWVRGGWYTLWQTLRLLLSSLCFALGFVAIYLAAQPLLMAKPMTYMPLYLIITGGCFSGGALLLTFTLLPKRNNARC